MIPALYVGDPFDCRDDALELRQEPIAHRLEDLAALPADRARNQPIVDPLHKAQGLTFVDLGQT